MGKYEDKRLDDLIELLKKFLSKREGSYKPKGIYRQPVRPIRLGGYRGKLSYGTSFRYRPEPYKSSRQVVEKAHYPNAPKEPIYRTKERLVYDPEVKRLLEKIERNLRSEPKEEDVLKLLEESPEIYEKISEKLSGKIEPEEDVEEKALEEKRSEPYLEDLETEAERYKASDVETRVESSSEYLGYLDKAELLEERSQDEPMEKVEPSESLVESIYAPKPDTIEHMEAEDFSSLEAELYQEDLEPNIDLTEMLEPNTEQQNIEEPIDAMELGSDIIEQIEVQDLSMLEAELYTEPLESMEMKAEPENDEYG